ncbi:minor tail protein [Gordonia phage Sour]|uniref:Uncharacterized protein n=1 Tax=Gordonia phage Sour TaxID=2182349 RepID=A0A2U8UKL2_9CAUD|nr:minor tail protein [Gordonia phage Sour]AWN04242.1 hypothetical protein PBI_SOUR_41 [Gordonia phage Sour]
MVDRLPAIDTANPVGERFPVIVREEIAAVASSYVTKESIGLGAVDNTSDLNKPLSSATQEALNGKLSKRTGNNLAYTNGADGQPSGVNYTSAPTAWTLAYRDGAGALRIGAGTEANHAVTLAQLTSATSGGIADGAVTTAKLADGAVTTIKIADGAVSVAKMGNDVGPAMSQIAATEAASYVTNVLLPIDTTELGNLAVTSAKLGDAAVTTAKIGDLQVTNAKIADGAVNSAKIANGSIALADLNSALQTSIGKADSALVGQNGATGLWVGTIAQLPATGTAGIFYGVTG